jgi:erythromycin esterase-like protein
MNIDPKATAAIKELALSFDYKNANYSALLDLIGNAQIVLIGEATHGTHEFYQVRAELTKQLIMHKNFNFVAIEGNWPDAYCINQYIKNQNPNFTNAEEALAGFQRFPTWMWRNTVVVKFIDWLKGYNRQLNAPQQVGFYGLDLYSLEKSIHLVSAQLAQIDQASANKASERYACFTRFKNNLQSYGYASDKQHLSCAAQADAQAHELAHIPPALRAKIQDEELFSLQQNAYVVQAAEKYYRSLLTSKPLAWNIRDSYMTDTLYRLLEEKTTQQLPYPKAIVWAHNSHIGDASATALGKIGEHTLGQLVKEDGYKAFSLGLMTSTGSVTVASNWDKPAERKQMRMPLSNSYEELFTHIANNFILDLNHPQLKEFLPREMLERAIGVIYRPQTELSSHYFYANLAQQFDAVMYLQETSALEPLETSALWHKGAVYETFPFGI